MLLSSIIFGVGLTWLIAGLFLRDKHYFLGMLCYLFGSVFLIYMITLL